MANKVQYGLKNVYYATVTVGTSTVTYGSPVAWPGAVSLSLSAEGDINDFYADNVKYFTAVANNGLVPPYIYCLNSCPQALHLYLAIISLSTSSPSFPPANAVIAALSNAPATCPAIAP